MPPTPRMTARTQVNAPFHPETISEDPRRQGHRRQRSQKPPNPQVTGYDFRELSSRSPRPGSVAAGP
ncbi:MAG: hypothetical protein QG622_1605 [Actinomycetota bacterium]|nr:hypothetical protein [Actinomycetota bacterium]